MQRRLRRRTDLRRRRLVCTGWIPICAFACSRFDIAHVARFLRLLASNHIYEEVRPDVFRNNRLSSLLDSGKSSADVIAKYVASFVVGHHDYLYFAQSQDQA